MTWKEPSAFVAKYNEYLHGNPEGDRRPVLDGESLPNILEAGNIHAVPRQDLFEKEISTLKEQAAEAARCEEHLVLLFFWGMAPQLMG